jgi:hypothetical protein
VAAIAETDKVMGRCEAGLARYRRALEGRKKATGENSMWTLSAVHGDLKFREWGIIIQGHWNIYYRRALDDRRKALGDDNQQNMECVHVLVEVYQLLGQEREAGRLCEVQESG